MSDWSPSRRTVLRSGGAVGAAAIAGCLPGGDGSADTPADADPIDRVPAGAKFVAHADVSRLLNDDRLRSRLNEFLAAAGEQLPAGEDVESLLDRVESSSGLDPRALRRATLFGGYEPTAPSGLRFEADWERSAVREALAGEATQETYNDRSVYRASETSALGIIDDHTFVLGTNAGVEGAIDVAAGDADPVSGRVREAVTAATDGPLRFGFESPPDLGEGDASGPIDPAAFGAITHGYGAYTVDGDSRSGSVTLAAESADKASTVADQLRTARDEALGNLEDTTANPDLAADVEAMLTSVEVSAEGSQVTLSVSEGEILPVLLVAVLASFVLGLGSQSTPVAPQAVFRFRYGPDSGDLTITHRGGDTIRASQLRIRGEGLGDTGSWSELGGSASGTLEREPAVVAGDTVTVSASSDYVARVVWRSPDEDVASVLSMNRGPDA